MTRARAAFRALRIACAFLTRVPVGPAQVQAQELGAAAACFPLIGFAIGGLYVGVHALCAPHLGPQLTAAILLALGALLTGGLHLDGLADWFDAAASRAERARLLEIMRDPRIGAHGASALVLVLLTKQLALSALPVETQRLSLLGAPACARAFVVLLSCMYPNARPDGLGKHFEQHVRARHALIAGAWCALGLWGFGRAALWPLVLSAASAALIAAWANTRLGGLTGDVYGAAIEIAEAVFFVTACVH